MSDHPRVETLSQADAREFFASPLKGEAVGIDELFAGLFPFDAFSHKGTTTQSPDLNIKEPWRLGIGIDLEADDLAAKLDIKQEVSDGAVPALKLTQADVSEEFVRFQGTAASGVLTQSLVAEADVSAATRVGFIKAYIVDDGDQITDQAVFIAAYTLA